MRDLAQKAQHVLIALLNSLSLQDNTELEFEMIMLGLANGVVFAGGAMKTHIC
jgi:hypothetical protein